MFNGKELDEETGLYYYGARYYDPKTSIWLSVDPLAEMRPNMSPYNYCSNNPINRIDPTGMIDGDNDDVIIKGNQSQQAFNDLQNSVGSELKLSMDSNGKLAASVNGDNELSKGASDLLSAINDSSVTVNVSATDDVYTSDNVSFRTGNFFGTELQSDGSVITKQEVHPDFLNKLDVANNKPVGQSILHEVTESYAGGKLSQKMGVSAPPATMSDQNNPKSIYYKAHRSVIPSAGDVNMRVMGQKDGYPTQINFYTGQNLNTLFYQYFFKF